jgi:hypothetical protein
MLAGRAAGTGAGTSSAAAAAPGISSLSGEPRSGVGAALADETGAGSDGVVVVVVGTDSVGVGSDCQDTVAGSALGQTVSPPVAVITTVRCSGVGCGVGCGAASGSALGGTESDGAGGGSVSVGGGSTTTGGGVVTTGGDVGAGAGSAICCPFTIVVLSPVVGGGCCSVEEGCSAAQASLELRTKAKRHKTSATTRARSLQPCRWAWMAVFLCGCPRVKSLGTLPIVPR